MKEIMKVSKKPKIKDYSTDYKSIIEDTSKFVVVSKEWANDGDMFKKYSIYENYSHVETSGSTTLTNPQ